MYALPAHCCAADVPPLRRRCTAAMQDAIHKAYCLSNLVLRNREAPLPLLLEMRVRPPLLGLPCLSL